MFKYYTLLVRKEVDATSLGFDTPNTISPWCAINGSHTRTVVAQQMKDLIASGKHRVLNVRIIVTTSKESERSQLVKAKVAELNSTL